MAVVREETQEEIDAGASHVVAVRVAEIVGTTRLAAHVKEDFFDWLEERSAGSSIIDYFCDNSDPTIESEHECFREFVVRHIRMYHAQYDGLYRDARGQVITAGPELPPVARPIPEENFAADLSHTRPTTALTHAVSTGKPFPSMELAPTGVIDEDKLTDMLVERDRSALARQVGQYSAECAAVVQCGGLSDEQEKELSAAFRGDDVEPSASVVVDSVEFGAVAFAAAVEAHLIGQPDPGGGVNRWCTTDYAVKATFAARRVADFWEDFVPGDRPPHRDKHKQGYDTYVPKLRWWSCFQGVKHNAQQAADEAMVLFLKLLVRHKRRSNHVDGIRARRMFNRCRQWHASRPVLVNRPGAGDPFYVRAFKPDKRWLVRQLLGDRPTLYSVWRAPVEWRMLDAEVDKDAGGDFMFGPFWVVLRRKIGLGVPAAMRLG